jgi:peptidoglycan hydrolase FlgJ
MSDIFSIQDYSNRFQRDSFNINKYRGITEANQNKDPNSVNPQGNMKTENNKSFEEVLKAQQIEKTQGTVSSADLVFPKNIKQEVAQDPYRKKLYDASVEFESIFVKMMLKEMKTSIHKSNLISGGHAEEIFEDMLYDEYAKNISKNDSVGIAEQVYSSLSSNLPPLKP